MTLVNEGNSSIPLFDRYKSIKQIRVTNSNRGKHLNSQEKQHNNRNTEVNNKQTTMTFKENMVG